ncbi:MAG: glycosyltransferase family 2 protein [Proteobacteria bacterium]|nr:glycosyltransferase family 2 protein [Pseudomonadota bacterium]
MSEANRLNIYLAIATIGRAKILCKVLERLALQTRRPDGIVVVGTNAADTEGVNRAMPGAEVLTSLKGLCRQRNVALTHIARRADVVIFIDDDFLAANDYIEQVERFMLADPGLVGLTGHLLGDGAHASEIMFDVAARMLTVPGRVTARASHDTNWLYGCNMAIRVAAAPDLRFDERLPLYGWQEDVDFSNRLGRLGRMMRMQELTGVHLGTRSGRISGVRFGYSQVANILYLRRKQTIGARHGFGLMARNIGSNLARSLWSEPDIDRRGRLAGNALGLMDLLRGRIDPGRVERL